MDREQSLNKLRALVNSKQLKQARDFSVSLCDRNQKDIEFWLARADIHFWLNEARSLRQCAMHVLQLCSQSPLNPAMIHMLNVLCAMCIQSGNVQAAIAICRFLLSTDSENKDLRLTLNQLCLLNGNFEHGWLVYVPEKCPWAFLKPWQGEPLTNKIIFVVMDQGIGDMIMFLRYVRLLMQQGASVYLGCHTKFHGFSAEDFGVDRIIFYGESVPYFDFDIAFSRLPAVFCTTLQTIPAEVPYLSIPNNACSVLETVINQYTKTLRVGLAWLGGNGDDLGRRRSIAIENLSSLFTIPGITFFTLPRWKGDLEISVFESANVINLEPYLNLEAITDTAAAVQALDLTISVDTTLVHLAGALGRPVWTLLPFAPEWRWMLNREDSPWYPTMRLFRQPKPGDWASVIARVKTQLTALVQERSTLSRIGTSG